MNFIKPLLLVLLFAWLLNSGDKYIINFYFGSTELASYAVPYSIGSKIFLVIDTMYVTYIAQSIYRVSSEKKSYIDLWNSTVKMLKLYYFVGVLICIFLFLANHFIGSLLLSSKFESTFLLIPFLGFAGLVFNSLLFLEQIAYAIKRTDIILKHYAVGAITNISLNLFLVPKYGILGATTSMILSVCVEFFALKLWIYKTLVVFNVKS